MPGFRPLPFRGGVVGPQQSDSLAGGRQSGLGTPHRGLRVLNLLTDLSLGP
jgi:hypothetical protein